MPKGLQSKRQKGVAEWADMGLPQAKRPKSHIVFFGCF
jgi:hypothetical protein